MKRVAHPTWIEIDLTQLRKNIEIVRKMIGNRLLCFPVKANAYGHGLVCVAKAAEPLVDCLAVSCLQEGVTLRQEGISKPILVLGAIHEDQVDDLIDYNLEFSISSQMKADFVAKKLKRQLQNSPRQQNRPFEPFCHPDLEPYSLRVCAQDQGKGLMPPCQTDSKSSIFLGRRALQLPLEQKCRVHLEVETGMQRTGVRCETALRLIEYLKSLPCFDIVGVYSHLATADAPGDPFAQKQIDAFQKLVRHPSFQGMTTHLANSGGVAFYPESYFDMVRPGRIVYGYLPPNPPPSLLQTAPCFSLKSRVSYFKVVGEGVGISYGHTYRTEKQTRIVTIPIGYGDGYRRSLSNRGSVLIRGKRFRISGMICMDQFMVDVGDQEVYVGDEVVLIGKQGDQEISLAEVASLCDSTTYELLCQFNDRIPRISLKE